MKASTGPPRRLKSGLSQPATAMTNSEGKIHTPPHMFQARDPIAVDENDASALMRHAAIGVRSIRFWTFLDGRLFAAKAPSLTCWISLDFLGFSRQNLDLSMSYADSSEEKISRALPGVSSPERERSVWAIGKAGLVMGMSLALLLIFRNGLLEHGAVRPRSGAGKSSGYRFF
jgi:hypothetical protein